MTPDELAAFELWESNQCDHNVFDAFSAGLAHARQQHAEEIKTQSNLDRDELIQIAKGAGFEANWIYKIPKLPDFLERFASALETPQRLKEIDRALDDVEYSGHYENGIYALKAQVEGLRKHLKTAHMALEMVADCTALIPSFKPLSGDDAESEEASREHVLNIVMAALAAIAQEAGK